jgi:ATP-dependent DNA helicase RecG
VAAEKVVDRMAEPLKKAIGPRSAKVLEEGLGLVTVADLLRHYPRRYLELGELTPIASLPMDESVSLVAEVKQVSVRDMRTKRGQIMNVVVTDGRGELHLAFFHNVGLQRKQLRPGVRALFSGKVSEFNQQRQLAQPLFELLEDDADGESLAERIARPFPLYPASAKVSSRMIQRAVGMVLDTLGTLPDPLPPEICLQRSLLDLRSALEQIHRPRTIDATWAARKRLIFEEAFILQSVMAWRRAVQLDQAATARPQKQGGLLSALDERLPFELTAGQRQVGAEIAADLARTHPMHRLLQGEVGSGKTLVALRAMLTVVDNGGQAALLAPTEVLAAQHHRSIVAMLGDLAQGGMLGGDERGTRVALLTGSLNAASRRRAMLDAASGAAGIVVGTHALLQEKVQFADLGLIVVDEQHRFGVEQRDALREKGITTPHTLVMTATPIPRTVAMTVFGDLETSTLRELPAGRAEIISHAFNGNDAKWAARMLRRMAEEVAQGHQVYVVCPRIGDVPEAILAKTERLEWDPEDESAVRQGSAVVDTLDRLRETPELSSLRIEMLHGRMPTDEREDVMRRFAAGEVDVLVATTVIEVGVDVPNATMMVVLDADRFGVSQLHQLRGRVGRGRAQGLCLLVSESRDEASVERLRRVASTRDGFELARLDLEQRREGDILGKDQSGGRSSLKLLRVLRDEKVIEDARAEAMALIARDEWLRGQPVLVEAMTGWLDTEKTDFLERG